MFKNVYLRDLRALFFGLFLALFFGRGEVGRFLGER